jgi:glucose-6-phosphate isomerase
MGDHPSLHSPLFLHHTLRPWSVDATRMGVTEADLDALPWADAFAAMERLEAGAIANPDEVRQVGHYWLRAPDRAPTMGHAATIGETENAVRDFVSEVHEGSVTAEDGLPFTDALHIGIGGSALGPQLLVDALARPGRGLRLHFVDNIDPDGIARVLSAIGDALRHTLIVVVSKSGGTVETARATDLVQRHLESKGLQWGPQCVAITGEGSQLHQRAEAEGWLATFPMWDWVGGRTSVTSAVGLLPAHLAGIDTAELLRGAAEIDAWTRHAAWRDNPAALLAGCWHHAGGGRGDKHMVVLPYSDRLLTLSRYLQQLVMESLGKRHDLDGEVVEQGLTVLGNKGSTDQHAFVQQLRDGRRDAFVTFVRVVGDGEGDTEPVAGQANGGDLLQGFLLGTRRALADDDRPSITLTVPEVSAAELGGLIALYERAVGLYAELVGINAYHQPGVEAGKKAAASIVRLQERVLASLGDLPRGAEAVASELQADPVEVHYLLQRLAHTGRIVVDGMGPDATYRRGRR